MQADPLIRVYLSSSFKDPKDVRAAIIEFINKQKSVFFLVNMEDYSAENTYPADKCVADVESCDMCIGVFAWRYGSVEPKTGKSITELELIAAQRKGIDILSYILDKSAPWSMHQGQGVKSGFLSIVAPLVSFLEVRRSELTVSLAVAAGWQDFLMGNSWIESALQARYKISEPRKIRFFNFSYGPN